MPAVRTVLRLFNLDESDGKITSLDSYGADTHVGTSCGHLIRLTTSLSPETRSQVATAVSAPSEQSAQSSAAALPGEPSGAALRALSPDETLVFTRVACRCVVSDAGAPVQQLQHGRSQRLLFVLCGGRLQLLHAETYAVLSTIAVEAASFSVAHPLSVTGCGVSCTANSDPNVSSADGAFSSAHARVCTGCLTLADDHCVHHHSAATAHLRTPSQSSYASSSTRTPRAALVATPAASPEASAFHSSKNIEQNSGGANHSRGCKSSGSSLLCAPSSPAISSSGGRSYVVCVAEKNKKQLSVYVIDRVSTSLPGAVSASSPCVAESTEHGGASCSTGLSLPTARSLPPPRVMLRQCYVLPEPAQCVLMCSPTPCLRRDPGLPYRATFGAATEDGLPPLLGSVEAGLNVCVGMRREVSLLSLLGGSPWCVLRLDGSRPPLISVGSDYNTFLVRTQAPNTVMEVGVPPAAATAGCVPNADGGRRTGSEAADAAVACPILLRSCTAGGAAVASGSTPAAVPGGALHGKEGELIMGDVFQADAPVELVLARFPHVFLFTAQHCSIVSLLDDGAGTGITSKNQRIPLPGIRYGALRGQGMSVCVASDRTVWMLQMSPLRMQLAEMVATGNSEGAFQLLAHHRRRTSATVRNAAAAIDADVALRSVESDLHRMTGFFALHRGEVSQAIRYLRGHVDPREVLLALPECFPPTATRGKHRASSGTPLQWTSVDVYVLDHIVHIPSLDKYWDSVEHSAHQSHDDAFKADGTSISPLPSYWDGWEGPCVYNRFAGGLAHAWRAAFRASSSSADAVEDFVARCFGLLKKEVRAWFAESLFMSAGSRSAVAHAPSLLEGDSHNFLHHDDSECYGASLPTTTVPPTLARNVLAAQRRCMEYASLVLAWQARDYHMAYQVVASVSQAVVVQDCADTLQRFREYRLLALLQFRAGFGEACCATLRQAVGVSAVLTQRHGHAAVQTTHVSSQLSRWRQCMSMHMSQGKNIGIPAPWPTCGSGLLMLPSPTAVARVAYTLFNIKSSLGPSNPGAATEALLDGILSYYATHCSSFPRANAAASTDGHTETNYCELRFSRRDRRTSHLFAFPHVGLFFIDPELQALLSQDTVTGIDTGATSEPRVSVPRRRPVGLMPSALTLFFYLVEKLDVVGVRQLLSRQPRLAQLRDGEGSTALHVSFSQLSLVGLPSTSAPQPPRPQASATARMPALQALCALNGLLVHFGCPVGALNIYGWSCLDVAAVACAGNTTAFDVVTAALLAAVEVRAVV